MYYLWLPCDRSQFGRREYWKKWQIVLHYCKYHILWLMCSRPLNIFYDSVCVLYVYKYDNKYLPQIIIEYYQTNVSRCHFIWKVRACSNFQAINPTPIILFVLISALFSLQVSTSEIVFVFDTLKLDASVVFSLGLGQVLQEQNTIKVAIKLMSGFLPSWSKRAYSDSIVCWDNSNCIVTGF